MMSAETQPAPRNVGGRPPGLARRRRELVQSYVQALGGPGRVSPVQMVEVERAASLVLLAAEMREKALRGEAIEIADLTRLEGTASRVIRSLNIPPPGSAAPGDDAWRKFLADHQAAPTGGGD
jgi:hypothetical protein